MDSTPLIVSFCNEAYIPVLANWFAAPGIPDGAKIRIYALDEATLDFAQSAGVEVERLSWSGGLDQLWKARIAVFRQLIEQGQSFVHSDTDAIWMRNPIEACMDNATDMSFSQGTIHPVNVLKQVGFVLCCGLFRMNATDGTRAFLRKLEENVAHTGDDQVSVNNVLLDVDTKWSGIDDPDYRLRFRAERLSCWKTTRTGRSERFGFTVNLIPHQYVQRIHDPLCQPGGAFVHHPLTPKEAAAKLKRFSEMGLCFIRPNWQELLPSSFSVLTNSLRQAQ